MEKYVQILVATYQNYAKYLAHEILNPSWGNYFYWLIGISLFFWLLEIVFPWRTEQGAIRKDFWLDSFYMFFNFFLFSLVGYAAVSNVVVTAFNDALLAVFGWHNLVAIRVGNLPVWAQLLILFLLRDFIQWNIHRLLHRFDWMWQFHKVHHSVEEMGFAAHLRFHWMENIFYRTLEFIPLSMIGFGIQDFLFVNLFTISWGHFNHANIRVPLGFLKYIFNNPQMHLWHHAEHVPNRYGVNFGLTLSVWDYLFGTAYIPYEGKDEKLGFDKREEFPKTFWGQIIYPFKKIKMLKNTAIIGFFVLFLVQCTAQTSNNRPHSQSPKLDKTLRIMLHFSVPTISIDSLKNMNDRVLLDAREQKEFDVSHIPTAQYCGYDHFDPSVLAGIPKDKNIVVYCSIGVRSEKIAEKIKALGYTHVSNLYGSLFEWVNTGNSVVDKTGNETRKVHAFSRLWSNYLDGKKAEKVW